MAKVKKTIVAIPNVGKNANENDPLEKFGNILKPTNTHTIQHLYYSIFISEK